MSVELTRLSWSGLKARDSDYRLAKINIFAGENGCGKSQVVDALFLLTYGRAASADLDDNHEGVMRLARDDHIRIEGWIDADGRYLGVVREWIRSITPRSGQVKVKEVITLKGAWPRTDGTLNEKKGLVQGLLGGLMDAWSPGEILRLTDAKLRKRLLDLIPREDMSLNRWVPPACPAWARPPEDDYQLGVLDWAHTAIKETARQLADLYKERRELEVVLGEVGDGWRGDQSIAPLQTRLAEYRTEGKKAAELGRDRRTLDRQKKKLEKMLESIDSLQAEGVGAPGVLFALVGGIIEAVREASAGIEPALIEYGRLSADLQEAKVRAQVAWATTNEDTGLSLEERDRAISEATAGRDELVAQLGEGKAASVGAVAKAQRALKESQERIDQLTELGAPWVGVPPADLKIALDETGTVLSAKERRVEELEHALTTLEGSLQALTKPSPLDQCPFCKKSLLKYLEDERETYRQEIAHNKTELADVRLQIKDVRNTRGLQMAADSLSAQLAAHRVLSTEVMEAEAKLSRRDALQTQLEACELRIAALHAAGRINEALAAESALTVAVQTIEAELVEHYGRGFRELPRAAAEAWSAHKDRERLREQLAALESERDDLEMDITIEGARLDSVEKTLKPASKIDAEAAAVEAEIERIGRINERADQLKEAKERHEKVGLLVAELLEWKKTFEDIETNLLGESKRWLEVALSSHIGEAVTVELRDPRGNNVCRVAIGGVDALAASDGEQFRLLASLIVGIAKAQPAVRYRPLIMDRFEVVSMKRRERFLLGVVSVVEAGTISQAFVAGCPDSLPEVEGVRVFWIEEDDTAPRADVLPLRTRPEVEA